jgi:hypothetical protein
MRHSILKALSSAPSFIMANDPVGHRGLLEQMLMCAVRRR